ncbi:MAG: hypothetical protein WCT46_06630 [Candidatus Gracilibacteria bacterium]
MDKSALIEMIRKSKVLDDDMRKVLLDAVSQFTPEKIDKIVAILQRAENKYEGIMIDLENKKRAINQAYLEKVDNFFRKVVPVVVRNAEGKDKVSEEADIDKLLSELDNI